MFIEKLHDLEVEEGDQLTLECQSPYSKMSAKTQCTPPKFVTKLKDEEVNYVEWHYLNINIMLAAMLLLVIHQTYCL